MKISDFKSLKDNGNLTANSLAPLNNSSKSTSGKEVKSAVKKATGAKKSEDNNGSNYQERSIAPLENA